MQLRHPNRPSGSDGRKGLIHLNCLRPLLMHRKWLHLCQSQTARSWNLKPSQMMLNQIQLKPPTHNLQKSMRASRRRLFEGVNVYSCQEREFWSGEPITRHVLMEFLARHFLVLVGTEATELVHHLFFVSCILDV